MVVLQDGCHPELRHSELGEVVEIFCDPRQVTTVPAIGMLSIRRLMEVIYCVVAGVTVCEAIGHDQIDRIPRTESLSITRVFTPRLEKVRHFRGGPIWSGI